MYKINYDNINKHNELYGKDQAFAVEFKERRFNIIRIFEKIKVVDIVFYNSAEYFINNYNNFNDDFIRELAKKIKTKSSIKKINLKNIDNKIVYSMNL